MKLYANMRCKGIKKPVTKGSNELIEIELTKSRTPEYWITYNEFGLTVEADGGIILQTGDKRQDTKCCSWCGKKSCCGDCD